MRAGGFAETDIVRAAGKVITPDDVLRGLLDGQNEAAAAVIHRGITAIVEVGVVDQRMISMHQVDAAVAAGGLEVEESVAAAGHQDLVVGCGRAIDEAIDDDVAS